MGNRAQVIFENEDGKGPVVYLHWNGSPESIYTFIRALDHYEVRNDVHYRTARFIQLVGNYFGGTLSLGVFAENTFHPSDNGIYVFKWDEDKWSVRRMLMGPGEKEIWLTPEEIDAEKNQAIMHPYNENDQLFKDVLEKNDQFFNKEV